MSVTSGAALATLSIPSESIKNDKLLTLITGLSSPLQLTIAILKPTKPAKKAAAGGKQSKGKTPTPPPTTTTTTPSATSLQLELFNGTILTQRNTILRTLCSFSLFPSALDSNPYNLLGGFSTCNAISTTSKLALSGVNSWMSYASTIDGDDWNATLGHVNGHLGKKHGNQSYLVNTGSVSLADLSVYFALMDKFPDLGDGDDSLKAYPHAARWLDQVQYCGRGWLEEVIESSVWAKDCEITKFVDCGLMNGSAPLFFYGEEEGLDALLGEGGKLVVSGGGGKSNASVVQKGKPNDKNGGNNDKKPAQGAAAGGGGGSELTEEQKKAAADKRAKKAAEKAAKKAKNKPAAPAAAAAAATLDISALDIRVGHIVKAWEHESAEKLYCEEVDVGEETGPRKIASGLRPFYKLDEMQNRRVLVLCNLKARNLVGFPSHGMVMCASNDDHTKVEFAVPPADAKIGERIAFEGFEGKEPEAENKVAKKKMFEKLAPDLVTDKEGNIEWKGHKAMTSAGQCSAVNAMPNAHVA